MVTKQVQTKVFGQDGQDWVSDDWEINKIMSNIEEDGLKIWWTMEKDEQG